MQRGGLISPDVWCTSLNLLSLEEISISTSSLDVRSHDAANFSMYTHVILLLFLSMNMDEALETALDMKPHQKLNVSGI